MKYLLPLLLILQIAIGAYLWRENVALKGNVATLGSTITTIQGTDRLTDSRSTINTNFSNLNSDKIEQSTTTLPRITTLSGLTSFGSAGASTTALGDLEVTRILEMGTGTTTGVNGVNVTGGCYAIGGTCLSASYFGASTFGYPFTNGSGYFATTTGGIFTASTSIQYFNSASSTIEVLAIPSLTSALLLTNGNGVLAEYGGASACTNQFVTALSALGASTCASINNDQWSGADLTVANGGTGLSTFGGTNTILYTTSADTLSSEAAFTYNPSTDVLTTLNLAFTNATGTSLTVLASSTIQNLNSTYATATTQLVAPIPRTYQIGTSTLGTGTSTKKLTGEPFAKTYVTIGANSAGGGTFVCQFGDSTASTSIVSSTGLTTTFSTISSNGVFTAGETIWFAIGSVSGTVVDPACTVQ